MSWQNRDYYRNQGSFGGGGMAMGFPKPTLYVKYLLIANIAMFILTALTGAGRDPSYYHYTIDHRTLGSYLALTNLGPKTLLHFWTLITYQFLHGDVLHILFNMMVLYFCGPPLERYWGSKRFLFFYLLCGVMGGLAFLALSTLTGNLNPIIGASGAVLGLLTACAVLFPQMMVIVILFPVPIRIIAILYAVLYTLNILQRWDLADACHLAGMVTGFLYIKGGPFWQRFQRERSQAKWEKLREDEQTDQKEVDRILEKVHQQGIQSLTGHEKKVLRDATRRQQQRDKFRKDY
jgi:membrane associated rhomboid family serine protease